MKRGAAAVLGGESSVEVGGSREGPLGPSPPPFPGHPSPHCMDSCAELSIARCLSIAALP